MSDSHATAVDALESADVEGAVMVTAAAEMAPPPLHDNDAAATAAMDGDVNNKWSKNGYGASVEKQTGKFNKEESELVRNAIEEYCNAKQISVSRLCSECDHKAELKGAWMEIAKRLPHRSVQSVYRHGIRQCHPFKRGAWSEQECVTLADLVTRLGKKWSTIQTKLNRSADSCRDKYREMSDEFVKGRWKEEETATLKRLIREHLNTITHGATTAIEDMKELGQLVEEGNLQIPWSIISKRMGKRSRLSCFKKWQKLTGIVVSSTTTHAVDDESGGSGGGGGGSGVASSKKLARMTTTLGIKREKPHDEEVEEGDDDDDELAHHTEVYEEDDDHHDPPLSSSHKRHKTDEMGLLPPDATAAETMVEALDLPDTSTATV
jgi:Myb-like DNA-binding domain